MYKQEGVNPLSGCLPNILQIAVLMIFFSAFNMVSRFAEGKITRETVNQQLIQNFKATESFKFGDTFLGSNLSTVNGKTIAFAKQVVNPQMLADAFDIFGDKGQTIRHEMTEAYQGGLIALDNKAKGIAFPAVPAGTDENGSLGYNTAHNNASLQPNEGFFSAFFPLQYKRISSNKKDSENFVNPFQMKSFIESKKIR